MADAPTAPPSHLNVDQPTGVVINGLAIDAMADPTLSAEEQAFVDSVNMQDPSIAAVVNRWHARESAPPATPTQPDPTALVDPHATRSPLQAPKVDDAELAEDYTPEPAPAAAPLAPANTEPEPTPELEPTPEPEPLTPAATSYTVTIGGQQVAVDQATVNAWGELAAWAGQLPDSTRQTIAAVTDGHMVAIPRDEAQAFLAWRQGQQVTPPVSQSPDFDDDDPASLRAELARLRGEVEQAPLQAAHAARSALDQQAQLAAYEAAILDSVQAFGAQHQLDEAALGTLIDYIGTTQLAASISRERTVIAPDGQVVAQPSPREVMDLSLQTAFRTLSSFARPTTDAAVEQQLEAERQSAARVDAKKNAQASLASTAPAAVTQPQRDPARPYAHQGEMQAGIMAELEDLLRQTPDGVLD